MELSAGGAGGHTGIARFDGLMAGTPHFARWKRVVEKRGFKVTVRQPGEMSVEVAAFVRPVIGTQIFAEGKR